VKLNGGRHVQGILRGFDPFMNLVIDECVEMATGGQQNNIGMVVSAAARLPRACETRSVRRRRTTRGVREPAFLSGREFSWVLGAAAAF